MKIRVELRRLSIEHVDGLGRRKCRRLLRVGRCGAHCRQTMLDCEDEWKCLSSDVVDMEICGELGGEHLLLTTSALDFLIVLYFRDLFLAFNVQEIKIDEALYSEHASNINLKDIIYKLSTVSKVMLQIER